MSSPFHCAIEQAKRRWAQRGTYEQHMRVVWLERLEAAALWPDLHGHWAERYEAERRMEREASE